MVVQLAKIKLLRSLPSPALEPGALSCNSQGLWHVDRQRRLILNIDVDTGELLQQFAFAGEAAALAATDQQNAPQIWITDTMAGKLYALELRTMEGNRTVWREQYTLPVRYRSEGGLGFDGRFLWCADPRHGRLMAYNFQSQDFDWVIELDAHVKAICWRQEELGFIQPQKAIFGILEARSSRPAKFFALPGLPNAVCYDGKSFWYVDAQLKQLCQFDLLT